MNRKRWFAALTLLYILTHLYPYYSIYASPNDDVANMLPVMFELLSPELYPGGELAQYLHSVFTRSAPVYFYALAYPLSLLVHPAHAMNLLGVVFSLLLVVFAGGSWDTREDWLRGILVGVVFLHASMGVNPLLGIMRSFLVVALAGVVWIQRRTSRWWFPVLILIATGVYPPAGLIVITYVFLRRIIEIRRNVWSWKPIRFLSTCAAGFTFPLLPYLFNLIDPSRSAAPYWVKSLRYEFGSAAEALNTFVFGWGPGSLFMSPSTRGAFVVFSILGLVQFCFLGRKKYRFRDALKYILGASLLLWALSHLLHPHLYQPSRYTRAALPFVAVMLFADNLFAFSRRLTRITRRFPLLRRGLIVLAVIPAGVFWAWRLTHPYDTVTNIHFLGDLYMGHAWPGFVFGLPLVLGLMFVPSITRVSNGTRAGVSAVVLVLFLFYPHCLIDCPAYHERHRRIVDYQGLFEHLHTTPKDARVAGPPSLMDPVLAYGRRNVPFRPEQNDLRFVCRRIRDFASTYYVSTPGPLLEYLRSRGIDYLLVDRTAFTDRDITSCGAPPPETSSPILNRPFPDAEWKRGDELYLVPTKQLQEVLRNPGQSNPGRSSSSGPGP